MFSESREYEEIMKIMLTSCVLAEITNRTQSKDTYESTAPLCSDIELRYRGIHPMWVDVMPSFLDEKKQQKGKWPDNACSACVSRGFYFVTFWNAILGQNRSNDSCVCNLDLQSEGQSVNDRV